MAGRVSPAPKAACVLSECGTEAHEFHRLSASCSPPLPTHSPPRDCSRTQISVAALVKNPQQLASKAAQALWRSDVAGATKTRQNQPLHGSSLLRPSHASPRRLLERHTQVREEECTKCYCLSGGNGCITLSLSTPHCKGVWLFFKTRSICNTKDGPCTVQGGLASYKLQNHIIERRLHYDRIVLNTNTPKMPHVFYGSTRNADAQKRSGSTHAKLLTTGTAAGEGWH